LKENGYILFVLNTHHPFVRHPETPYPIEEYWLFESMIDCYIPLIEVMKKLVSDDVAFKITFSLTPTLIMMLQDNLLRQRFTKYLDDRIQLLKSEIELLKNDEALSNVAVYHFHRMLTVRKLYFEDYKMDLISCFCSLLNSGKIDILASSATHAYLPIWQQNPAIVDLQISLGVELYRRTFGKKPTGFWLPECGYFPGVDEILSKHGIVYTFLDSHGILNGNPQPKYGVYSPVYSPSGLAIFGRNWASHNMVWLKDKGYPGHGAYLNYDKDIGFERDINYLFHFTHSKDKIPTGIRYLRNGFYNETEPYDHKFSKSICRNHAEDFLLRCQEMVNNIKMQEERKPVLVGLFDTEHFGHWWHEGPDWLDSVLRTAATNKQSIKFITAADYLHEYSTNQVVIPSMSSWGYQGYSEVWLMGRNYWIYPLVYHYLDVLSELLLNLPQNPATNIKRAFNQCIRELLQTQGSDWAFILHQETAVDYAIKTVKGHVNNIDSIVSQLNDTNINERLLYKMESQNNIFIDFNLYELFLSCNPLNFIQ
jgi:1,4-alpha-glucan branching enzyme